MKSIKVISLLFLLLLTLLTVSMINQTAFSQENVGGLQLVAIGDSTPAGQGIKPEDNYLRVYADYIKEDLGVNVKIINWAKNEKKNLFGWVQAVTTDEIFRMDLKNADIITIWISWHEIMPYIYKTERVYKKELDMTTRKMGDSFNILFAEIRRIVDTDNTLILAAETGIPPAIAETWKENGFYQELKQYAYEDWRSYLLKAAEENNIKVVSTYKALNGSEGNSQLPAAYYQKDGINFSAQGHKLIAELHRNMGYIPIK